DKLLDGINGLELIALQEGDGFTEQKSEPAPIDEANEVTFPVDPSIKAKAEAEIKSTHSDVPLMMTDPVASYINYFSTRGKGTLEHSLARSGRYRDMIQKTLAEEGVPQDLIYLALAESGFHPLALSRASPGHVAVYGEPGQRIRLGTQLVGRRPPESRESHTRRSPSLERSLQPVRRLVSGYGGLQLRSRNRAERRKAHRLCGLLGTLSPQRAAQGNPELRADYCGCDHHGQESGAVRIGRCST